MIRSLIAVGVVCIASVAQATQPAESITATLLVHGSILTGPNNDPIVPGPEGNWFGQIGYELEGDLLEVRSLFTIADGRTWLDGLAFSFGLPDLDRPILSASVVRAIGEGWSQIDESDLHLTADSLLIDAAAISGSPVTLAEQSLTVRLTTVPEPSSLLLATCGSLLVLHRLCRRP